jgi:hypothetical protein
MVEVEEVEYLEIEPISALSREITQLIENFSWSTCKASFTQMSYVAANGLCPSRDLGLSSAAAEDHRCRPHHGLRIATVPFARLSNTIVRLLHFSGSHKCSIVLGGVGCSKPGRTGSAFAPKDDRWVRTLSGPDAVGDDANRTRFSG